MKPWDAGGTPVSLAVQMNVSVLLRLLPEPLARGCLVGEVEVVRTGQRALVRSVEELVAYLQGVASPAATEPGTAQEAMPGTT